MNMDPAPESSSTAPRWRPLTRTQRRVAGVLVEKAKTTPEAYPLSLNALTTGCNQKSNRSPQMSLSPDDVEEAIDELRQLGAVAVVDSGGRVLRYRHYMYEWLGVDKLELAVMAELLLRGEQTIGELRGRAARMEPIDSVSDLKPILASLLAKNLLVELTPEGRGQLVTHNLYQPEELEKIRRQVGSAPPSPPPHAPGPLTAPAAHTPAPPAAAPSPAPVTQAPAASAVPQPRGVSLDDFNELQVEVAELRAAVSRLTDELRQLRETVEG